MNRSRDQIKTTEQFSTKLLSSPGHTSKAHNDLKKQGLADLDEVQTTQAIRLAECQVLMNFCTT